MPSPTEIVETFLAKWDRPGGWKQSVLDHFSDESVYENIGMSRSEGLDAILDFIRHYDDMTGGGWMVAETSAIAAAGNVVMTERIDHMVDGKGNVFLTTPVMGAFEVRDGKITAWRDYFDTACINPPYDGPGAISRA